MADWSVISAAIGSATRQPNHANLFDGGYARQAEQMMRKLLAG